MDAPTPRRKLIEASIPLEKINTQSAREKSIRYGHPSTLHQWWSRKPTATARAVIFAQIVDDPSTRPDLFPTVEEQEAERRELFYIIEQISNWDVVKDDKGGFLDKAREKIQLYTGGNPPPVIDPFAGGGSIPLEAQRLGLEAHASDVNPVAVLLEKALIEIPSQFTGQPPVHPVEETDSIKDLKTSTWKGAEGLAEDVRYYGAWMLEKARERIGHLYPEAKLEDGSSVPVIAWLWARTVKCPNPTCGVEAPLTSSWWVSKKKGNKAFVSPAFTPTGANYKVIHSEDGPAKEYDGTINGRTGGLCAACGSSLSMKYIRDFSTKQGMGTVLLATVAAGKRQRHYISPAPSQIRAAQIPRPRNLPSGSIALNPRWFSPPQYGITEFSDLFTNRQATTLTTLSHLISEVVTEIEKDFPETVPNKKAPEYAKAIATVLALCVSKLANNSAMTTTWMTDRGAFRETFSRQALPMSWDFAESNPLGNHGGGLYENIQKAARALESAPSSAHGIATVDSALTADLSGKILSTDPPYYDYIGYSDLSDFYYIWLRSSLRPIYPELFNRTLVPKSEELVANPYRHGGTEEAQQFFEDGFVEFFDHARKNALPDYPATVYYAFKQQDTKASETASTGWETVLEGIIRSGWQITATWPMRTESTGRILAKGTNAIASTIALVLRPRPEISEIITRAEFLDELKSTLPDALRDLQKGTISPVDLPQSAIGPGMAIFSKYNGVLESDGHKMTVRAALSIINEILDEVLAEQEGDYKPDTRFALAWFRTYGFERSNFGHADNLARARNTSIEHLERSGILSSGRGEVKLYSPAELHEADQTEPYDPAEDDSVSAWETVLHLAKELEYGNGVEGAGHLLARVPLQIERELCKQLAFLLFKISEARSESKTALLFNQLGTSWNDIEQAARASSADPHSSPFISNTLF